MNKEENEVYRAVNKYVDFNTGDEYLQYSKVYNRPGPAKSNATLRRGGKGVKPRPLTRNGGKYEYVTTWCERASEWEVI